MSHSLQPMCKSWYRHPSFLPDAAGPGRVKHGPGRRAKASLYRSSRAPLFSWAGFPSGRVSGADSSVSEDLHVWCFVFCVVLTKPALTNKASLMASCLKEGWPLQKEKTKTVPGSKSGQECGKDPGLWVCPKRPQPWAGPSCAQMEEPSPAGPASQTVGSALTDG